MLTRHGEILSALLEHQAIIRRLSNKVIQREMAILYLAEQYGALRAEWNC